MSFAFSFSLNRQRFVKDPQTGKRQARLNPEAEWIVEEVPQLRIVDDALWDQVKARQEKCRSRVRTHDAGIRPERAHRPRYLLSGLLSAAPAAAASPRSAKATMAAPRPATRAPATIA